MIYLCDSSAANNAEEYKIAEKVFENVALAMNFSRVDLVEHLHPDKGIEDNCKVDRWRRAEGLAGTIFNAQDNMAFEEKHHDDNNLNMYFTLHVDNVLQLEDTAVRA